VGPKRLIDQCSSLESSRLAAGRRRRLQLIVLVILTLTSIIGSASEPLRVPHMDHPPAIDGRLEPGEWTGALKVSGFWRYNPDEGPPRYPTTAWIGLTDGALFIAFEASKPQGEVKRDFNLRDEIKNDELSIVLDPYRTGRYGYYFGSDANGSQDDGLMTGNDFDLSWDGIWESAGGLSSIGFVVEMRIPLSTIRYRGSGEQVWRVQLTRWDPVHGDWETWPPSHRSGGPWLLQAADVVLDVPAGQSERAVIPHLVSTQVKNSGQAAASSLDAGADLLVGLGPSLTARATINPDFSQVEVDQPQQDRNQRFPLYYPEKRPFFTAGLEVWDTPIAAFYSRRIVNPDWGLKLNGRHGPTAFFLVAARDVVDPEQPGSVDATDLAFKVNRELGKGSHVGATVVAQNRADGSNVAAGLDAVLQPLPTLRLTLQGLASRDRVGETNRNGGAYDLAANYDDGVARGTLRIFGTSAAFADRLAFIQRTDYRGVEGAAGHSWWIRGKSLAAVDLDASVLYGTDFGGHLTDREMKAGVGLRYRHSASVSLDLARRVEVVRGVRHSLGVAELSGEIPSTRRFAATFHLTTGDGVNYDLNVGGTTVDLGVGGRLNASRNLLFDFSVERYRFRGPVGSNLEATALWIRSYWFFSTRTAVRLLLQRYAASTIRYGELLFIYVARPGTAIYIGASSDRLPSSGQLDRRLFAKMSYRFDLQ